MTDTTSPQPSPTTLPHADLSPPQRTGRAPAVTLSEYTAAAVAELLALAEEFLRTAGPAVHAQLRAYLAAQVPPADPAWFIDMLGFNAADLARRLPADPPCPRQNWTAHAGAGTEAVNR